MFRLEILFVLLSIGTLNPVNGIDLTCRSEATLIEGLTGEALDWYTVYKMPKLAVSKKLHDSSLPFLPEGLAYMFMTNASQKWHMSSISMNDTDSMSGRTLQALYANDSDIGYILYNDQAKSVSVVRGHTKGVLLFNDKSIVWLVHSIPHFPPMANEKHYTIHDSQCVYGQSMLCMTFNFEQLESIGEQLFFNYPQIYDYYIPEKLKSTKAKELEPLMNVISGKHPTQQPWTSLKFLSTKNGEKMLSFAKFTNYGEDLYSGFVAPNLKSELLTETWNNGVGTLKSNCSASITYHVMNIEKVRVALIGQSFSVHHDHSKWAVTNSSMQIACIGDINRQAEQFKRSGGTVCFVNNKNVWSQYHGLVQDIEPCERTKFRSRLMSRVMKAYEIAKAKFWCVLMNKCD